MDVSKKEGNTSTTNQERHILGFRDSEKVWWILKEILPLVIRVPIANFDVSRVLIDGDSSYDIMYGDLFENMGLKKEKLLSYEGSDLQAFNGNVTRP